MLMASLFVANISRSNLNIKKLDNEGVKIKVEPVDDEIDMSESPFVCLVCIHFVIKLTTVFSL